MKKLLVLALAVVLTLSLAVVASAATFDPYVGGEFQLNYSPDAYGEDALGNDTGVATGDLKNDANGARFKSYVTGRVDDKDTGTWAKIGVLFTSWNNNDVSDWSEIFEAGIKVNDNLTIWYTNDENNDTDRGQVPLYQNWYKYGGDPLFDYGPNDGLGIKYGADTLDAAFIYAFDKTGIDDENEMFAAATFKFDGGNVHFAYRDATDDTTHTLVGAEYKFGFGTLKGDYSLWGAAAGGDDASVIQVSADLLDSKLNVTVLSDDGKLFTDGGIGFGVTYNINDKLYVGGRSITASESNADLDRDNQTNIYLGIKYGVFDTRIGSATIAEDDSIFYVTTHVGMW